MGESIRWCGMCEKKTIFQYNPRTSHSQCSICRYRGIHVNRKGTQYIRDEMPPTKEQIKNLTVRDLFNLESKNFTDYEGYCFVIYYRLTNNIMERKVRSILTPLEIYKIQNLKRGEVNINEMLYKIALKYHVIRGI
jgi:hypothetical protein